MVGRIRALQVFVRGKLRVRIARVECRRGRRAELIAGREHPRMPRARKRRYRGRTAPDTRRRRKSPGERLPGSIGSGVRDYGLADLMAEIDAGDHVAWKR